MNERIKELYQTASGISKMSTDFMEDWEFKFAEFIIKDIAEFVDENTLYDDLGNVETVDYDMITKHYGILK